MSSQGFKIGDRVTGVGTFQGISVDDLTGTIVDDCSGEYGIYWDINVGGHSCTGMCPDGHGWYVPHGQVKPLEMTYTASQEGDRDDDI